MNKRLLPSSFGDKNFGNKERGVIMIITMIAMLTISMILAYSIDNTSLSTKSSANYQKKRQTFQAAQSGIDTVIAKMNSGDMTMFNEALASPNGESSEYDVETGDDKVGTKVKVKYVSDIMLTQNQSMNADESSSQLKNLRFEVYSVGEDDKNSDMVTTIRQGVELY